MCVKNRKTHTTSPSWMYYVTEKNSPHMSTIYMDTPIKRVDIPSLAHEVTHVLQYICESRGIEFEKEQEHMAYIMGYIMSKILGTEYDT